jgi:hypothetical protein
VYDVIHNGKDFKCARVTSLIEATSPTPRSLQRYFVNEAVNSVEASYECINGLLTPQEVRAYAWEAKDRRSKEAMDTGSKVHKAIQTGDVFKDPEVNQSLKAFDLFKEQYKPTAIAQEVTIYDTTDLVAGTVDFIGYLNHDLKTVWILDWKTSKSISDSYFLQVSIYHKMLTQFLKMFRKDRSLFSPETSAWAATLTAKKRFNLRCGVVRLDKKVPMRAKTPAKFEFVGMDMAQIRDYQKEFKLAVKLFKQRRERWERQKSSEQKDE